MIDPIAIGMTKEHICKGDKENPTVWLIGAIDSMEQAAILDSLDLKNKGAQSNFIVVKYGLKGFRNFKIDGVDVEFKTEKIKFMDKDRDVVSDETLKQIPHFVIIELSSEIWESNRPKEEQEKN